MTRTFSGVGLALCLLGAGCGPNPNVPYVAVREAQLRSERYPLPLTEDAKGQLLLYLAAGGNDDGIEDGAVVTLVYPDADKRWGALLSLLGDPANADADDLTNGTYAKWFHGPPLRQVIDATAERPNLACPPYAADNERFVWIFECGDPGKLGRVFVQLAIAAREGE